MRNCALLSIMILASGSLAGCGPTLPDTLTESEEGGDAPEVIEPADVDPSQVDSPEPALVAEPDIPDNAYCSSVMEWSAERAQFEDEVLALVNERRAAGADCGGEGSFPPSAPLLSNGRLRCAARNHSADMGARDFFDHTNPDGDGPGERLTSAEYSWASWGENIAWGYLTPQEVVDGWMSSPGHCANIMDRGFTELGVGYALDDDAPLWTLAFGNR